MQEVQAEAAPRRKKIPWVLGCLSVLLFIFFIFVACMLPFLMFAGSSAVTGDQQFDGSVTYVDMENLTLSSAYPSADPDRWLNGDVDINPVFARRLAALAQDSNEAIYISSGYRSVAEQWEIWNKRKREHPGEPDSETRKWVAYPGTSRHQFGLAADVEGYAQYLGNSELAPFGLYKPLSNENWHIEPVETRGNGGYDVPEVLPEDLKFVEFDVPKFKAFLNKQNSILADEAYMSTIIGVAKEKGVNALFMFAIIGQEQAYVPRTDENAVEIANNPFNVNHSWFEYNTDIHDSSVIAANTIKNLSCDRPASENVVRWINLRGGAGGYAGDPNWWVGVSRIFVQLKNEVG